MSDVNTRIVVLNIIHHVLAADRFLSDAVESALKEHPDLQDRDKRFVERLSYLVIEKKTALDAVLNKVSTVPVRKMKPVVREILYIGACQILFMETGDHAAVNEAVKMAVKRGFSGLKGFVNGILRQISREKESLLSGLSLSEKSGIPENLYDMLVSWYDEETADRICRACTDADGGKLTVRRNTSRCTEEAFLASLRADGADAVPTKLVKDTYYLKLKRDPETENRTEKTENGKDIGLTQLEAFKSGLFYVQDLSSAVSGDIVADLLAKAGPDFKVLDTCAAPGGKTVHIADLLAGKGSVTACDVSEKKTALIRENAARAQFDNIRTEVQDARVYREDFEEAFDLVICDVPCSGLGVLIKKPDIRYHVTEESMAELVKIQRSILKNVQRYVKPGGTLVFSTCTVNPAENEENLFWFLERFAAFDTVSIKKKLPERLRTETAEDGYVQLIPGVHPCDGFFMARLEKM